MYMLPASIPDLPLPLSENIDASRLGVEALLLLQMNHGRGQCVVRRQRFTAGDVLQLKGGVIAYPSTRDH